MPVQITKDNERHCPHQPLPVHPAAIWQDTLDPVPLNYRVIQAETPQLVLNVTINKGLVYFYDLLYNLYIFVLSVATGLDT